MLDDFEVLILCGGEGRRLRSMISDVPKPMAPIGDKPFLYHLVKNITQQGFHDFCLLTGYKTEHISDYFQNNFKNLNIRFSVEDVPLGTGGAIFKAAKTSPFKKFLVLNGDTFFNIDLKKFIQNWKVGTLKIALKYTDNALRYGVVEVDAQGKVISFLEKGASGSHNTKNLINGGIYILDASLLEGNAEDDKFISLENDVFPKLLKEGKIFSSPFEDEFIDIGVPEDYIRASLLIEQWASKVR